MPWECFFLVSDGGLYLDSYHTSTMGEEGQDVSVLMTQGIFRSGISSMKQEEECIEKEEV